MSKRPLEVPHYQLLRDGLRELPSSGLRGFEGLVCDLLSGLTGRRFFLAAAGSQDGRDLSTGGLGGTWIAVEAKRYRENTALRMGELLSELSQLCSHTPHPDLWVLVASRPVTDQAVSRLRQAGLREGVEIEILDASRGRPGDLDFLCASDPEATVRTLSEAFLPTLQALREETTFDQSIESLRQRLSAPALGFDHVRNRAWTWFREALEAPEEARARLGGQPLTPLLPTTHYVRRGRAEGALEKWWRGWILRPSPFVLLGEEGVGKSWAVAAWAESLAADAADTILLFASSRDINTTEPRELIRTCLCEVTGSGHSVPGFWERRLESWLARPTGAASLLLLVLDGINERPSFEWRDLFDRLNGSAWRETVAVLVTCRPGYWTEVRLMPEQAPCQWTLEGFDDQELDEALQANDRQRSEFASELLPLLRKPRYFSLALSHYDRLEETGDFTLDRLLYEDWKDRLGRKRCLKLSDGEFRRLLGELAQRYRAGCVRFSKPELEKLLPGDAASDLAELLTGGLLSVDRGLLQSYKVEPSWLIHSLGLLLADQLVEITDRTDINEELAHYLEPHLEVDQQGDILAAAILYALLASNYPQEARQALLHAWLSRQNHSQNSVDRLQAYVPIGSEDYLALLEDSVLYRDLDYRAVERIEFALLAWRCVPKVEAALVKRATRWLGLIHPEGFRYRRAQKLREAKGSAAEQEASDRHRNEIEERAGGSLTVGRTLRLTEDDTLEVTSSDRFARLADSALYFLSALPELHRLAPIRRWALSRAVIGHPREWTQVAWLLRGAAAQEFEDGFFRMVEPLLDSARPAVQRAGGELLGCLGTPRATQRRATMRKELRKIVPDREAEHEDDRCRTWRWRREDCVECSEREELTDLFVARRLSAHALDPCFEIPRRPLQGSGGRLLRSISRECGGGALEPQRKAILRASNLLSQ